MIVQLPARRRHTAGSVLWFQKGSSAGAERSLMCSFLQLVGDKWGKSSTRGWCVIPQDDPLVLYVYAAPQVMPPPGPQALAFSQHVGVGEGILLAHTSDLETEAQCRHSSLEPQD